jgi:hypothetical protein
LEKENLEKNVEEQNNEASPHITFTFGFEDSTITPATTSHHVEHLGVTQGSFFLKRKSIINMRNASFVA